MTDHHCLYRFFGADGVLLYVGITCDPSRRWPEHMKTKPWWTQVTKITLETHPSRDAVLAAEIAAITREHPQHNVIGNPQHDSFDDDRLDFDREPLSQVRSFDHGEIAAMPEYAAAQKALNDLAHALDARVQDGDYEYGNRRNWIEIPADMASVLGFSDACPVTHDDTTTVDWIRQPFRVERHGTSLQCHYHCPAHQQVWSCHYSTWLLEWVTR